MCIIRPICLIIAHSTEAPVSATTTAFVLFILVLSGISEVCGCSSAHWSSCGLMMTWSWLELLSLGLDFHFLLSISNTRL